MVWWINKPLLYQKFKEEMREFDYLTVVTEGKTKIIVGQWPVYGKTELIRRYEVRIELLDDYPFSTPRVFEVGNEIPKSLDRHFNVIDESACLFVSPERWSRWPIGSGINTFLNGPVKEFFFSQAYFDLKHKWPFGDWAHGAKGIIDFFLLHLKLPNRPAVTVRASWGHFDKFQTGNLPIISSYSV